MFEEVDGRVRAYMSLHTAGAAMTRPRPREPFEWVGRTETAAQRTVVLLQRARMWPSGKPWAAARGVQAALPPSSPPAGTLLSPSPPRHRSKKEPDGGWQQLCYYFE